jgi:hypothetical protein
VANVNSKDVCKHANEAPAGSFHNDVPLRRVGLPLYDEETRVRASPRGSQNYVILCMS